MAIFKNNQEMFDRHGTELTQLDEELKRIHTVFRELETEDRDLNYIFLQSIGMSTQAFLRISQAGEMLERGETKEAAHSLQSMKTYVEEMKRFQSRIHQLAKSKERTEHKGT